jgi:hypothetical protein
MRARESPRQGNRSVPVFLEVDVAKRHEAIVSRKEGFMNNPGSGLVSRPMQLRHLAEAERHIADGMRHIADQERVIGKMKRAGHDTSLALKILATFRLIQDRHLEHRERILRELDRYTVG